jgi:hypothetical protein
LEIYENESINKQKLEGKFNPNKSKAGLKTELFDLVGAIPI